MVALIIEKFEKKALVVGPIYDKIEILHSQKKLWEQQELIIFNGNLCYPNDDLNQVEKRIEIMDDLIQSGKVIYNLGDQDLLLLRRLDQNRQYPKIRNWLQNKSNVVIIKYLTQTQLVITNGGVLPTMQQKDLHHNFETSFISNINNQPWHRQYGGSYGYIISNNPLTQEAPEYHNFSLQLGNVYHQKSLTYAAQVGQYGIERIFSL
jgi:hypothetical protein